ncbi:MAG: hypothetical protein SPI72_06605 [Porphyromonas sp.]|nr:hypothetical protein [Porphyromonas sp.]
MEQNNGALEKMTYDSSNGTITTTSSQSMPTSGGSSEAYVVVSKGDLARTIHVVLRSPFAFNPVKLNDHTSSVSISGGQGQTAKLSFKIPDDFPETLLPLPVKIYARGLYPVAAGLELRVEARRQDLLRLQCHQQGGTDSGVQDK